MFPFITIFLFCAVNPIFPHNKIKRYNKIFFIFIIITFIPTHFTAFQVTPLSLCSSENYAQKKARDFLVYSHSEVFGVTYQQNNQKPTLIARAFSNIPVDIHYSRQTFRMNRIKLKRFSNMS